MERDSNQKPHHEDEERKVNSEEQSQNQEEETVNQHASTYQPEVTHHPEREYVEQTQAGSNQGSRQKKNAENKKVNFDFEKSLNETKGILKDAVLRPHSLISSKRSISIETSAIILVLLSIIVGLVAYFSMRNIMENMFGGLGSLFGAELGAGFFFQTVLGWIATFAIGYFSVFFMLQYFGNRKMNHKELLTKYVVVNIPFVLVFCVVIVFFGFLMVDFFIVTYVFALMLFGMIHIYLFLVNYDKPKFDLFWLISIYLFVLLAATYLLAGVDIPGF